MFDNKVMQMFLEVVRRRSVLLPAAALATSVGCSSMHAAEEADDGPKPPITINVYFDGNCPQTVNYLSLTLERGDRVQWQAVDMSGAASEDQFKVYFDPFSGATISTQPSGLTTPVQTVASTPPANVDYKYTIVGDDCTGDPLDPYLRIL